MTIYQGVNGVNREIKQIHQGVGGVNRELKERYEGVGGVNRKVLISGIFLILYDNGVEELSVSGGWVPSSGNSGQIIIEKRANNLYTCSNAGNSKNAVTFMTANKIDLTDYNYLKFVIAEATTSDSYNTGAYIGQIGLCESPPTWTSLDNRDGLYGRVKTVDVRNGSIPDQVDISSYNGEYYIYFGCNEGNAWYVRQIIMYKIWLE